jgi:hypothetical protein
MRGLATSMAAGALAGMILWTSAAPAMSVRLYDQMAKSDRANYLNLLIRGAAGALNAHGDRQRVDKLFVLFGNNGGTQFDQNLAVIRQVNKENEADPRHNKPPYEVEHAFYLTLQDNGIIVPIAVLLAINKDFKPSSPGTDRPTKP